MTFTLGYECVLGALEMGYNVNGFLVVDEKTLLNPWNFKGKLKLCIYIITIDV